MSISDREFENVTYTDLVQLKENQVAEGFLYEYKLQIYGRSDDDKREALKDVSSFANSAGGHIVIGMDEQQGLPTDLAGICGRSPKAGLGEATFERLGERPDEDHRCSGAGAVSSV
jgi:Putative DNA-binding domain